MLILVNSKNLFNCMTYIHHLYNAIHTCIPNFMDKLGESDCCAKLVVSPLLGAWWMEVRYSC